MADYEESKTTVGGQYIAGTIETTWKRTEPLITPAQLKSRELFGIPLVSGLKDPVTGKAAIMGPEVLKDLIDRAVSIAEAETGLVFFEDQVEVRMPYDRAEYQSLGYMRLPHRPISSIDTLQIQIGDTEVFDVPSDWWDVGQLHAGQLNLIALSAALVGPTNVVPSGFGAHVLHALVHGGPWIPSFWSVTYTIGFKDGAVPKLVNELIGAVAAMEALEMLAATNAKATSGSLVIDGVSMSQSGGGPEMFKPRLESLEKKRLMLTKKLKMIFGTGVLISNV